MSNARPEAEVYNLITALKPNLGVYEGPVTDGPSVPDEAVFCIGTGGPAPQSFHGSDPEQYKEKAVQVRIRAAKNDFDGGRQLGQDIWSELANAQPSAWVIFRMITSDTIYLGQDAEGRHEWSINIVAIIVE